MPLRSRRLALAGKCSYASLISERGASARAPSSASTASRISAAIFPFGALSTRALAVGRDEHDLVLGRVEPDARRADVVEDDEVRVLRRRASALALEPRLAVIGAERHEHLPGALALAERACDVDRRRELERPGVVALGALCRRSASTGR